MNRLAAALLLVVIGSGCTQYKKITGTEEKTPAAQKAHESFVVSCCRDNNAGVLTYPSFVPAEHVQLCETARIACHDADCQINGDTYLPMSVDCELDYKIGSQYYKGHGY